MGKTEGKYDKDRQDATNLAAQLLRSVQEAAARDGKEEEEASPIPPASGADEEMVLAPWEPDAPVEEDEDDAVDVVDPDWEEDDEDGLADAEDVGEDEDEDDLEALGVDEEISDEDVALFFSVAEEADGAAVDLSAPDGLLVDDRFVNDPDGEDELPREDDLPEDFVDIADDGVAEKDVTENKIPSAGAPIITEAEVAMLFRSDGGYVPHAPLAPVDAPHTQAGKPLVANEDNGYAVEVEVRRPAAPEMKSEPAQEDPSAAMAEVEKENMPAEDAHRATPGLSNGETRWTENYTRRRPVEVIEADGVEEADGDETDDRGIFAEEKASAAEYGEKNEKNTVRKEKARPKKEKKTEDPFGPAVQLSIDDVKKEDVEKKTHRFAFPFLKGKGKSTADDATGEVDEGASLESVCTEEALHKPQNALPRRTAREVAMEDLYSEEVAAYHEYTSRNQSALFCRKFESELTFLALRIGILSFLATTLLILENGLSWGIPFERLFPQPVLATGLHLLLLFFAMLCSIPLYIHAWRRLFAGQVVSELFVAVLLLFGILYDAILCFALIPGGDVSATVGLPDLHLFGLLPAVGSLLAAIADFYKVKSDLSAFHLISSAGDKLACTVLPVETRTKGEADALSDLEEGSHTRMAAVKKVGFTTGFFRRISRNCEDGQKNLWLLPTAGVAALLTAIITGILSHDLLDACYAFCVGLSISLPACALLLHKAPVSVLSRYASQNSCAVAGEVSAIEYSDIGAFAFEDVEAFPARNVRVQRIKLYNDSVLDHVMYQVAGVFSVVGGPLDGYFRSSTAELGLSSDVHLLDAPEGGIVASVDRARILVGSGDFMLKNDVRMYYDAEDEQILAGGKTCIMYAAEEGQLIAKFYIRYRMNEEFEKDVERLFACGIRVLLRTYDPNIRAALIREISYTGKFDLHVVRKTVTQQKDYATPQLNSGIVSRLSVREALRVLLACRRTCRLTVALEKGGLVVGCFGMLLSIVLSTFGILSVLPTYLLALYQLAWVVPILLSSKFYITRKKP